VCSGYQKQAVSIGGDLFFAVCYVALWVILTTGIVYRFSFFRFKSIIHIKENVKKRLRRSTSKVFTLRGEIKINFFSH